jgi:hypothetical protein
VDEPIPASEVAPEAMPRKQREWDSRITGTGVADPATLNANPMNWRSHDGRQEQALTEALDGAGWVQGIIVNETTGNVVDGHLRLKLAQTRGMTEVPVTYVSLDEAEEKLVLATLDPISSLAIMDEGAFKGLLSDVEGEIGEHLDSMIRDMTGIGQPRDIESRLPTQDEIDKRSDELDSRYDGKTKGKLVDVTCTECHGDFSIDLADFRDSRYDS